MSTPQGPIPFEPDARESAENGLAPAIEPVSAPVVDSLSAAESAPGELAPDATLPASSPLLFRRYEMPESRAELRIPNLGHVGILALIAVCGLFGASLAARAALETHLFGVTTVAQAAGDIHYTLGAEAILYLLTFAGSLLIFPVLWHKGFFAGLQWRGRTALALRRRLVSAAMICFLLALANGILIPGPENTPIDRLFRTPGAAWLLFAFGVTAAPFFEELAFRGFLLPAFCTAFDWMRERWEGLPPGTLDESGHPLWSRPAMGAAAVLTSVLFALLHGDQTGYAVGPFLLLVCVSLVLSWARLGTRSLAASVVVHACYNFILFSFMFLGTSGFRHLDKM